MLCASFAELRPSIYRGVLPFPYSAMTGSHTIYLMHQSFTSINFPDATLVTQRGCFGNLSRSRYPVFVRDLHVQPTVNRRSRAMLQQLALRPRCLPVVIAPSTCEPTAKLTGHSLVSTQSVFDACDEGKSFNYLRSDLAESGLRFPIAFIASLSHRLHRLHRLHRTFVRSILTNIMECKCSVTICESIYASTTFSSLKNVSV